MKRLSFLANAGEVDAIEALVRSAKYPNASSFLRAAVDEKLRRLRRAYLNAQVARYCAEGYANEDRDLVANQAFGRQRR